uniref:Uncharacterized protein n=1 Tax=Molossus molossus TaxID=27622 RepID=A0A7J8CYU3_MOLMO|nr:hypothetical protein HJG59_009448 [Molossus molossus]
METSTCTNAIRWGRSSPLSGLWPPRRCEGWCFPNTCPGVRARADWALRALMKGVSKTYLCLPQSWAWERMTTTMRERNKPAMLGHLYSPQ